MARPKRLNPTVQITRLYEQDMAFVCTILSDHIKRSQKRIQHFAANGRPIAVAFEQGHKNAVVLLRKRFWKRLRTAQRKLQEKENEYGRK